MRFDRILVLVLGAALVAAAGHASAQSVPEQPKAGRSNAIAKTDKRTARVQKPDRTARLDALFEVLAKAPDANIAKVIESRLESLLAQSGSDTSDLLMGRARVAMEAKESDLALGLLDSVVAIQPDFVEARARRATVYFLQKDYARSLADLRMVLAREPRHYGALSGLGVIMQDLGEDKRALEAFRKALSIHPYLTGVTDLVKKLTVKVEGREI
jgi:tetratricopeptide (TPR) repeat protein